MDDLTPQQRSFVIHLVGDGVSPTEAVRRAGYSVKSAKEIASQLMRKPHIVEAVRQEQGKVLATLGGKALRVIDQLLDDPDAPAGVRLDAAKTVLDRVGLVSARTPAQPVLPNGDRPLTEADVAELRTLVAALESIQPKHTPASQTLN